MGLVTRYEVKPELTEGTCFAVRYPTGQLRMIFLSEVDAERLCKGHHVVLRTSHGERIVMSPTTLTQSQPTSLQLAFCCGVAVGLLVAVLSRRGNNS